MTKPTFVLGLLLLLLLLLVAAAATGAAAAAAVGAPLCCARPNISSSVRCKHDIVADQRRQSGTCINKTLQVEFRGEHTADLGTTHLRFANAFYLGLLDLKPIGAL